MDDKPEIKQKLTSEDIKNYIDEGGVRCPYCGSYNISTYTPHIVDEDRGGLVQKVCCGNCRKTWADFYKIVEVMEKE